MESEKIVILFLGVNIGFWCIGILFYIIQLTGPLNSLTSILYLFTTFSFGLCSLFGYLVLINLESDNLYIYVIIDTVFANGSAGYFAILIANIYKIIERKWLYLLCALPIPLSIGVNLWSFQMFFDALKIETGMDLSTLAVVSDILVIITEFLINCI
jgi:hypothetical protein